MAGNFKVTAKAEIGVHYCTHPGKCLSLRQGRGLSYPVTGAAIMYLALR